MGPNLRFHTLRDALCQSKHKQNVCYISSQCVLFIIICVPMKIEVLITFNQPYSAVIHLHIRYILHQKIFFN